MLATLILLLALGGVAALSCPPPPSELRLPNATASGYLPIDDEGSQLFFMLYEAQGEGPDGSNGDADRHSRLPITLWLQGGPGCASLFGAFYELGPELVDAELGMQPNPGAWNRNSALLFIDQPVGSGFSMAGKGRSIPRDEMTLAADLYCGLQAFFDRYPDMQGRPLVIAGESYAGKYVPSMGHFILQQQTATEEKGEANWRLQHHRTIPPHLLASRPLLSQPPLFKLQALVIGNGLTDPASQVMTHADTAYFQGYIDPHQRLKAMAMQLEVVQLIAAERWEEAHGLRTALLEHISSSSGAATLFDMSRYEEYDAGKLVDCYLNLPEVQEALGVAPGLRFEACSEEVGEALGPDVMKSVKHLVPDLLAAYPLLLYQGMRDGQDGAASSEAWIYSLDWEERVAFTGAKRHILHAKDMDVEEGGWLAKEQAVGGNNSLPKSAGHETSGVAEADGKGSELVVGGGAGTQRQLQAAAAITSSLAGNRQQQARFRQQQGGPAAAGVQRDASAQRVVAYWKQGGGLTHVVLTEAGHMVPRDAPLATRWMLERWLAAVTDGV